MFEAFRHPSRSFGTTASLSFALELLAYVPIFMEEIGSNEVWDFFSTKACSYGSLSGCDTSKLNSNRILIEQTRRVSMTRNLSLLDLIPDLLNLLLGELHF